jgi:acyl transferase domain-containing protein
MTNDTYTTDNQTGNQSYTAEETGFEVAIIGMAGRFPGAKNLDEYWDNLKNGRETVSFFTDEEIEAAGVSRDVMEQPNYVKARGLLEDQEYFDSTFFNYTPIEASVMDPQVRIFHQCCWHGLEHAGYGPHSGNQLIGLYAGASIALNWEAYHLFNRRTNAVLGYAATYLRKDFICTRISYRLGLKGPAFYLQTACSTSLVAMHLACQALINSECRMALAGGVSLTHQGTAGYLYTEGMVGSKDGHCRAFDAEASGTVRGEGAGVVVLKMLDRARKDGDTIHAIVKGTAINNDGDRKVGFTAPSINGQAEVIWAALQMAEVEPESISYIETHGTGTRLGDPVEVNALRKVFKNNKKGSCALGAVKPNIGHLDTAAGVAGVIKATLAFKHRLLPPSINYSNPNPEIDFQDSPFYVNAELSEWKNNGRPLRAGVSSFGIGGTNAHVILEEPPRPRQSTGSRKHQLFVMSAKSETALNNLTRNLAEHLENNPGINPADAAYTLQVGRKAFRHRRMFVASGHKEALDALSENGNENGTAYMNTYLSSDQNKPVIFMFPGQGAQYENMGQQLYREEPLFRRQMDRCFEIVRPIFKSSTGRNLEDILYPAANVQEQEEPAVNRTVITQPLLFVFEYSLAKLLMAWGIMPYAMTGHSIGEYVAACLAGVMSLEDALQLVCYRGQLMQELPPGAMLSVPLAEEELKPYLDDEVSVAALNTTARSVVSGSYEAVEALEERLKENGIETRRLHTSHAFHSKMMDPILETFTVRVKNTTLNKPEIPYISNVTGTWITTSDAVDPAYWAKHLRQTVRFSEGISELLKKEDALMLEVGPGKALGTFVNRHMEKKPGQLAVSLIRHPKDNAADDVFLLNKIGQLWGLGAAIDWKKYYEGEQRNRIPMPVYPFDRIAYPTTINFDALGIEGVTGSDDDTGGLEPGNALKAAVGAPGETTADSGGSAPALQHRPALSTAYVAPGNETEKKVAAVFEEFFGIQPIGINDDFYELGGDSLNAVQLANLARQSKIELTFQQVLVGQTIREICKTIDAAADTAEKAARPVDFKEIETYLSEKYGTGTYYREYLVQEMPYRVLFLTGENSAKYEIHQVFDDMASMETDGDIPFPGYLVSNCEAENIPEPGVIDENRLVELLGLTSEIGEDQLTQYREQLALNQRLDEWLKTGDKVMEYNVSPVQMAYLIPPYQGAAQNFIYYSHIFTYPVDVPQITAVVARLLEQNPLLKSVILQQDGGHRICEYASFSEYRLPVIDISSYAPSARNDIASQINRMLREPMDVIDHVLFRAALVKMDHCTFRLVFLFNHLIFDGTSIGVLDNQLRQLAEGKDGNVDKDDAETREGKPEINHYSDYVRFMQEQNYEGIEFESFVDTEKYLQACQQINRDFNGGETRTEVFDLDISKIPGDYKEHFEEIVILTYGRLIRELTGVEDSPITFVSNGRFYKDAAFNGIIGEFPDEIPVQLSFGSNRSVVEMMEHFTAYKRFIRENNFNFYNFLMKGYLGQAAAGLSLSPFIYNSLMGSYDLLTRIRSEEADMQGAMGHVDSPLFYLGVMEDYYAGKVGIRFIQNTGSDLQETFLKNYTDLLKNLG